VSKIYYYVHTGHRIGLDRFRRAVAIIKALEDIDITLLCSDFRIAQEAYKYGIKEAVGIDLVQNISNIAQNGDQLILDSDEANPIMLEDMKNYFSTFIHIQSDALAIEKQYFQNHPKTIPLSFFFGDDDYEKDLLQYIDIFEGLDVNLQLGFYYFLDYEEELQSKFPSYTEFDEYEEMIQSSKILITSSPQAALESLASGGKPIYIQRKDYTKDYNKLLASLHIPILEKFDRYELRNTIDNIKQHSYKVLKEDKSNRLIIFIRENLKL